jgi:Xaa-Pro dipeptidase
MSEIHLERRAQAARLLSDAGADVLVIYAQGSAAGMASQSHAYARYLADWDSGGNFSVIVLMPGARPVVFVPNITLEFFAREYRPELDVRFVKPGGFAGEVGTYLVSKLPGFGRIAYIGRYEMPQPLWARLQVHCAGYPFIDFEHYVDTLRVQRSDEEIATHRKAAAICDGLFESAFDLARSGKPVFQIRADMQREALYAGCDYASGWLTSRPVADYSRALLAECRNVPQTGDQYLVGVMLQYEGCWGHGIRMAHLGDPTDVHLRAYDAVLAMQQAMLDAMRPGVEVGELQTAASAVREHFYHDADTFEFRYGHALGYAYDDPLPQGAVPFPQRYECEQPYRSDVKLAPNLLFELHPNVFVRGVAGAALGDMALVTQSGHELLTQFPSELAVL